MKKRSVKTRSVKKAVKHAVHRAKKVAAHVFIRWVFGTMYVIGLSLLLPFLYFLDVRGKTSPSLLTVSLVCILVSFIGFAHYTKTMGNALRALGKITLVPGVIAVFLSYVSRSAVIEIIHPRIAAEALLYVAQFFEHSVPKVHALAFFYILLGGMLYLLGRKV